MRKLSNGEWAGLREEAARCVDLTKSLAEGVFREPPLRTRFFAHHYHDDEYSFWVRTAAAVGDSTILIVGCDGAVPEQRPLEFPRAYEFAAEDTNATCRKLLKFTQYDRMPFYHWFDTFAVWSPSKGWLSYLNNRDDIGLISAFSAQAVDAIDGLASDIFLKLDDLQRRESWHYLDIDPAMLVSSYNFRTG